MEIRFVSSLTPDDESRIASAVLAAVGKLLEDLPIAYMLQIDTGTGQVFQQTHPSVDARPTVPENRTSAGLDAAVTEGADAGGRGRPRALKVARPADGGDDETTDARPAAVKNGRSSRTAGANGRVICVPQRNLADLTALK